MLCHGFVKIEELRLSTAPVAFVGAAVTVEIGFVPYFPVFYVKFVSVRPAFVVVTNYMFADFRPFPKIFRRHRIVLFDLMFYRPNLKYVSVPASSVARIDSSVHAKSYEAGSFTSASKFGKIAEISCA